MADFVKKTWSCGDTITADDLNRLEGGVEDALECCGSNSVLVVKPVNEEEIDGKSVTTYSCTYRELLNALQGAGARVLFGSRTSQPIVDYDPSVSSSLRIRYGFGASGDWQTFDFDPPQGGLDSAITYTASVS